MSSLYQIGVTACVMYLLTLQNSRTQSTPLVTCSVTCGGGYEVLTTSCENQAPFKNGAPCYVEIKNVLCNTQPCPVNGAWGAWFNDGCTVTCGGGFLTKRRYCIDPLPANNGTQCKLNNGLFTTRRKLYEEVEEKCMETPCAN